MRASHFPRHHNVAVVDVGSAQRMVDAAGIVSFSGDLRAPPRRRQQRCLRPLRRQPAHLVVKVYGERMAWKMGKEVLVYGLLTSLPVPTPEICSPTTAARWSTRPTS